LVHGKTRRKVGRAPAASGTKAPRKRPNLGLMAKKRNCNVQTAQTEEKKRNDPAQKRERNLCYSEEKIGEESKMADRRTPALQRRKAIVYVE